MNQKGFYIVILLVFLISILLVVISTDFVSLFRGITGYATTAPVTINITVSGTNVPVVFVDNQSMTSISGGPNEGPTTTLLKINLTIYDADGFGDINDSDTRVNFTRSGETPRYNTTCLNTLDFSTYYANFTCQVLMYWYDGSGLWTITANASDSTGRNSSNTTQNFFVGATDAFVAAPTTLTWATLTAGQIDQNASNNPVLSNNTGNINKLINVNSTNLRGESTSSLALWAGNFSVSGGSQCRSLNMTDHTYVNITSTNLPKGNFSVNNGTVGQEQIYFCLNLVGTELTAQSYSTANESTWTIQIVTSS